MPLLPEPNYQPSKIFRNGHLSTIYSGVIKKIESPDYIRKKWDLPDGDFLNIDYKITNPKRAVVLFHGLEGDSTRTYNNSCAQFFLQKDFSIVAWNNRGCGGEMNNLPNLYHHAVVDDVEQVLKFAIELGFEEIYLVGFSMGAAQIMNYFGRKDVPQQVKKGVAISAPIYLKSSAESLKKGFNQVYLKRFIRKIKKKLLVKSIQFPTATDWTFLNQIKTFDEIDEFYTSKFHGFDNADDYYLRASPAYSMDDIKTPVLVINAWDDPFLGVECYPKEYAQQHPFVYLEIPKFGGHCAFPMSKSKFAWTDYRAYEFFMS